MERRSKIILGLLATVLLSIIVTEIVRPKPINWRPSYTSTSKIPFGCFVLFNELPTIFPNSKIQTVQESVYDLLVTRDSSRLSSYVIINDFISLDKQETNQLLNYVAEGNQVFIAASELGGLLVDTLNIGIDRYYDIREDSITLNLTNNSFKENAFIFERGMVPAYFTSLDTANTEVLGQISFRNKTFLNNAENAFKKAPNFIRTKFGKGSFLINTTPIGFTNYYMLKENEMYVAHAFSYLQDELLYWDDYKKSGRAIITSPLRFVLTQPALKWVYYLSMAGLLLFVIFKAKRQQRIIPIIKPLENSSVEFARTVGSLYHHSKDFTSLNNKKINFFLSHLRRQYYVDTTVIDEQFTTQLAIKSGHSLKETKELIEFIIGLKKRSIHSEQDTIALSQKINTFKKAYGK